VKGAPKALLDNLIGGTEQRFWHVEAKRLGGFQVDYQFV
jgi:hypothetical protein